MGAGSEQPGTPIVMRGRARVAASPLLVRPYMDTPVGADQGVRGAHGRVSARGTDRMERGARGRVSARSDVPTG